MMHINSKYFHRINKYETIIYNANNKTVKLIPNGSVSAPINEYREAIKRTLKLYHQEDVVKKELDDILKWLNSLQNDISS